MLEPIYPYVEAHTEPSSFEAMTLLLFQRRFPYMSGTLSTSGFSEENHVVSRTDLTKMFPASHLSSISLPRVWFLYLLIIGDTIDICSIICLHMIEIFQSTANIVGLSYEC